MSACAKWGHPPPEGQGGRTTDRDDGTDERLREKEI